MTGDLDIAPLRSLVAIADCGGFQRAGARLHLSQGAVSGHVRRLEAAVGRPLVERHGRGSRFTADGERLLAHARRLLSLHDDALASFGAESAKTIIVGATEHAAARLLPALSATLEQSAPGYRFRFRIDRGMRLRGDLTAGRIDLALLLNVADDPDGMPVGQLDLTWYSAPTWQPPRPPHPVPVVAFDNPCALRTRAFDTLARESLPAIIGAEAIQLAGVQAAVSAGLGVALMATLDRTPEGLIARDDLPRPEPLTLYVCSRPGLSRAAERLATALRPLLSAPRSAAPA